MMNVSEISRKCPGLPERNAFFALIIRQTKTEKKSLKEEKQVIKLLSD